MSILKRWNYNRFLLEILSIISILLLSLIPWLDFLNNNLKEFNTIFNDSFVLLLNLYLLVVAILYFALRIFIKKSSLFNISFVGISIWIFFQYNFLENKLFLLFEKSAGFWKNYSSEITFIFVLILIFLLFLFLDKKKFLRIFILFFLSFNFMYSSINFFPEFLKHINTNNNEVLERSSFNKYSINQNNKPNIYFFVIDAMKPLNEFENFYDVDLEIFKNFYKEKNYTYYENTKNLYKSTKYVMASFFNLSEISIKESNEFNTKSEKDAQNTFPTILKSKYEPNLIKELNQIGYKFIWMGNIFANCSKTNYKYCANSKKENYLDIYLLQSFLNKTPFIQIFNIITNFDIIKKNFDLNNTQDSIFELNNFINSNKDSLSSINPKFFLIHDVQTHQPYVVDSTCEYKRFPGRFNLKGYKNSYLCSVKKISTIIETLDKYDPNSLVIFQSDHNWIMSWSEKEKYGNRKNIFNLIKNNVACTNTLPDNPNNINILNYLLDCLKNEKYKLKL